MIMESHESLRLAYGPSFYVFEIISIVIFSTEYLYRIGYAVSKKGFAGALGYIFSFYGIIDLISILPFTLTKSLKLTDASSEFYVSSV